MPNGPIRKNPAWRSSSVPKTLGASNDGTHSQSIAPSGATSALVWQFDRNAYSAIGGNGEGAAALCGAAAGRGGSTVVLTPPTARASARPRRRAGRPPAGPTCPWHRDGPVAAP